MKRQVVINKDAVFNRYNAGTRIHGVGEDVERQMLGIARLIAQETTFQEYRAFQLTARLLKDGNVAVLTPYVPVTWPAADLGDAAIGLTFLGLGIWMAVAK